MATTSATAPMMSGIGGPPQGANGTVGAGDAPGKTGDMGRVPELLAVTSILTVSMIIVVVLRIYLKLQTGIKSVRLVDWMHVLAAVCQPKRLDGLMNLFNSLIRIFDFAVILSCGISCCSHLCSIRRRQTQI